MAMGAILRPLSELIPVHIMAFEYPKYGLCVESQESSEKMVNNHAESTYSFVCDTLEWPADRIIVHGHSLGTGPACHIASTRLIGGLVLQSAFTSLPNLIQEKIGILSIFINIPCFDNLQSMKRTHCPTLFIHGQRDSLIPFHHSQILFNSLYHTEKKRLVLLPDDDHSSISACTIFSFVQSFLRENFSPTFRGMTRIEIPLALMSTPPIFQR